MSQDLQISSPIEVRHHRLDRLLQPKSIAIVGASDKPGSNGHAMISMCRIDGYRGQVYPVNPRLREVEGIPCYPDLASLPHVPEHVVIGVASRYVEEILDQAIAMGVKAATIFASCHLDADTSPWLPQRIAKKARAAGMQICGANCMGFYTPGIGFRVASMDSPPGIRRGGIAWIVQSGSALGALAHNDRRLGFTLCASTGMELVTTVADYMDWALDQPETRVIGLFLETVRDPGLFVSVLDRARDCGVPVVALKVGRTEKSTEMAMSHTGAMVGNDAAYRALFDAYGVTRVDDMDEMAATLALFDMPRRLGAGGLATVHDSGGERELIVDLAEDEGVPFAEISETTRAELAAHLEPGLKPENPLDAYGTHNGLVDRYAALTTALAEDDAVALTMFMSNPRDHYAYAQNYTTALIQAAQMTDKALVMASNYSMADDRGLAQQLGEAGIPLLKGTRNALRAVRHVLAHRDFQARPPRAALVRTALGDVEQTATRWRARLEEGLGLTEVEGLKMLAEFGLNTPQMALVNEAHDLGPAIKNLGFPLVMKTAENHAHKSDVGGVVVNLRVKSEVEEAYDRMAKALGPQVVLMQMVPSGVELALGAVWDDSFGPVVLISAGGVLIEFLKDMVPAIAPFDPEEAKRLIGTLKSARLLKGVRGAAPADIDALARQASAFSVMVAALGNAVSEIDVNPLICSGQGIFAVDCLVTGAAKISGPAKI